MGLVLAAAMLALSPANVRAQSEPPPNILLIISDDYGSPYYGLMIDALQQQLGNFTGQAEQDCSKPSPTCVDLRIQTPNLDRLAREGIVFQQGYATESACEPASDSIFTGLNQRDLGANPVIGCNQKGLETIPHALGFHSSEGTRSVPRYNTFLAGKSYFGDTENDFNDDTYNNEGLRDDDGHELNLALHSLRDKSVGESTSLAPIKQFIKAQHSSTPWFVVWSPQSPHGQYAGIPPHINLPPPAYGHYDNMESHNPPHITSTNFSPSTTADYYSAISYFDERVGEVVEFLETLEARSCANMTQVPGQGVDVFEPRTDNPPGLPPNPLRQGSNDERDWWDVSCLGDQGQGCAPTPFSCEVRGSEDATACDPNPNYDPYHGTLPYHSSPVNYPASSSKKCSTLTNADDGGRYAGFRTRTLILYVTDNPAGLQNSKGQFSENGLRTPIIVNYPNKVPPTGLSTALVGQIDLFPTVLDYAQRAPRPFPDSLSFRQLVERTQTESSWRRYFVSNGSIGVTSPISIIDRDGVDHDNNPSTPNQQYRLYTGSAGEVAQKVFNLTKNPFENGTNLYANGFVTDAGLSTGPTTHAKFLRKAACDWRTCLTTAQRSSIAADLSAGACSTPSTCGNGIVEGTEECDDGNLDTWDGCTPRCRRLGGAASCVRYSQPLLPSNYSLTSPPCPTPKPS